MPFDVEKTMVFKAYHTYTLVKKYGRIDTHSLQGSLGDPIHTYLWRIEWVKNGIVEQALHFSVMARGHAIHIAPLHLCLEIGRKPF